MATELAHAFGARAPQPNVTGAWRPGDVRHVFATTDRAAKHLSFRAEVTFRDGMREFATAQLRQ
jgi:dTDP-L-rhamnose 4-epimerase